MSREATGMPLWPDWGVSGTCLWRSGLAGDRAGIRELIGGVDHGQRLSASASLGDGLPVAVDGSGGMGIQTLGA